MSTLVDKFCDKQQLSSSAHEVILQWYSPLGDRVAKQHNNGPFVLGINGCQGSGKSTLADWLAFYLKEHYKKTIAVLSIDDVYLTQIERYKLSETVHPLMITRGVPGTHDVQLLEHSLDALKRHGQYACPRFNKATDDRFDQQAWPTYTTPVDIIILEGWCIGVTPEPTISLDFPFNRLEAKEDPKGLWRHYVNQSILQYQPAFNSIDYLVMLRAPGIECLAQWRGRQEQQLAKNNSGSAVMNAHQIERFVAHYERLTQHMLNTVPAYADEVFQLNVKHQVISHRSLHE